MRICNINTITTQDTQYLSQNNQALKSEVLILLMKTVERIINK